MVGINVNHPQSNALARVWQDTLVIYSAWDSNTDTGPFFLGYGLGSGSHRHMPKLLLMLRCWDPLLPFSLSCLVIILAIRISLATSTLFHNAHQSWVCYSISLPFSFFWQMTGRRSQAVEVHHFTYSIPGTCPSVWHERAYASTMAWLCWTLTVSLFLDMPWIVDVGFGLRRNGPKKKKGEREGTKKDGLKVSQLPTHTQLQKVPFSFFLRKYGPSLKERGNAHWLETGHSLTQKLLNLLSTRNARYPKV